MAAAAESLPLPPDVKVEIVFRTAEADLHGSMTRNVTP
jgi:hypothetical protein